MPCATCGELMHMTEQGGATEEGPFHETYECLNGHHGSIRGDAAAPPRAWNKTGRVFNDY